ncbi:MAG TPA: DUF389 domain-containing protein [Burkholderiales bacterium]|nr:DUF389 domain-containing protein [Burkholderiales bacterium]
MRLIRITVPKGRGRDVAKLAFDCGIKDLTIHAVEQHKPGGETKNKEAVDMHVATPDGRAVVEAIVRAPFYDRQEFSIDIREPRAVLKAASVREIARPVAAPMVDIDQELWQFSHVTVSFAVRFMIAAVLLAYGMIHDNPLLMIGGLVFLPFMPLVLGIAFGALDRQWKLVAQSAIAFVTGTLLIVAMGVAVAAWTDPPLAFHQFPPVIAGVVLSLLVGIAGAVATADDVGHRQLIGLAAASQIALIPAWFGISLVFGFTQSPAEKLMAFGLNAVALVLGAAAVYGVLMWRSAQYKPGGTRAAAHKPKASRA